MNDNVWQLNLNEQTTYLDSLIQNNPLGIVVLDRQGSCGTGEFQLLKNSFSIDQHELASIDIGSHRRYL